ncbi:MAG: acyl-ACP--UDP-N-acetylglucosamine O-acyltransferase [Pseudomonadota bacterium]
MTDNDVLLKENKVNQPIVKADIHPTAIIGDHVIIGQNVSIGPYSVISDNVKIGDNCQIMSHVVISGNSLIGKNNQIFSFASIGSAPQDLKFSGENSSLKIGDNNIIREYVTINPGTKGGGMVTHIGSNCLFMIGSHIAHDCIIGDHVVIANNSAIAGHVEIGDHAIIGGLSGIRQFIRIGAHAMIGGMTGVENDVIPYGQAVGERAFLSGLNLVGLKRRGFSKENINNLRRAFKLLFNDSNVLNKRVEIVQDMFQDDDYVQNIVDFILEGQNNSVCQPKND